MQVKKKKKLLQLKIGSVFHRPFLGKGMVEKGGASCPEGV